MLYETDDVNVEGHKASAYSERQQISQTTTHRPTATTFCSREARGLLFLLFHRGGKKDEADTLRPTYGTVCTM